MARLKVLRPKLEAVVLRAIDHHRLAADDAGHQQVGAPVWGGDNHLVALVHGRQQGVEDHALAAVADGDLVQGVVQAGVALELALDGSLERRRAVLGRILGVAPQRRLVRGLDGMGRAVEVGFADGEGDDVDAIGAHLPGADRHGDGGRDRRAGQALG